MGYQVAASIERWSIDQARGAWVFRCQLRDVNAHWLRQRPLDLVAVFGQTELVWEDVALARVTDPEGTPQEYRVELTSRPAVVGRGAAAEGR